MAIINRRRISEVLSFCHLPFFQRRNDPDYVQPGDVDENGNLIVTLYTGNAPTPIITPDMDPQDPLPVNVTALDTVIIPANPNRQAIIITNISDTAMNISPGRAGAPNAAPQVNASGGVYTLSRYGSVFTTREIHASHVGVGAKVATYQEFH